MLKREEAARWLMLPYEHVSLTARSNLRELHRGARAPADEGSEGRLRSKCRDACAGGVGGSTHLCSQGSGRANWTIQTTLDGLENLLTSLLDSRVLRDVARKAISK